MKNIFISSSTKKYLSISVITYCVNSNSCDNSYHKGLFPIVRKLGEVFLLYFVLFCPIRRIFVYTIMFHFKTLN